MVLSRDPQNFRVPPNILGMGKATNVKFGRAYSQGQAKEMPAIIFPKKGRGPGHVTPKIFRVPLISQERVKLRV